jgi:large subunit ribosomal protein L4
VSDDIFAKKFNPELIHQVVQAYLAGGRAGTRAQKTRAEVRGGGRKPWKQKGTGNARAGTIRSPLWRGGGVVFAAKPQDYSQKINKKMYCGAMCSILAELARKDRLVLVNDFAAASPKTKDLIKKLHELKLEKVLIVLSEIEPNLYLAARNLKNVNVCDVNSVNPVDLIGYEKVLFTVPALKKIEEKLV